MTRFNALLVVGVAALVLSSSVQASVVENLVDVFLDGLRSDQKSDPVGVNTDARVHDALELGQSLMKAFGPILLNQDLMDLNASEGFEAPKIRFLELVEDGQSEERDIAALLNRNLIETDSAAAASDESTDEDVAASADSSDEGVEADATVESSESDEDSAVETATAHGEVGKQAVDVWVSEAAKWIAKIPILVESIYLKRIASLGGGTCSFEWYMKLIPFKFMKPVGADCQQIPKTHIGTATNRWCVVFKLFGRVELTHCAPAEYWRELVAGEIIYVNPSNGATVIDVIKLAQSGGLDAIIPLRSAFGQGGPLDILNYL
mmetsp:Transcript_14965/g.38053  ORF Transcript_14965/g.38053 Transcript_14965/m.38053 type:complete len:320 (+) Transcript_14965:303-1262(+)